MEKFEWNNDKLVDTNTVPGVTLSIFKFVGPVKPTLRLYCTPGHRSIQKQNEGLADIVYQLRLYLFLESKYIFISR